MEEKITLEPITKIGWFNDDIINRAMEDIKWKMKICINLDKESEKIFKKINKLKPYGWISKEFQELLKTKYGIDRKILAQLAEEHPAIFDKIIESVKTK